MTWKIAFFALLVASTVINCSKTPDPFLDRSRMMQPLEMTSFHPALTVKIGWMPYQAQKLMQTGRNEWRIVKHQSSDREGAVPVIIVTHPNSPDSILLDMNIKNELLGKLIKHSAITQEPIQRPFTAFFETAKCENCHPEDVKVDFGR